MNEGMRLSYRDDGPAMQCCWQQFSLRVWIQECTVNHAPMTLAPFRIAGSFCPPAIVSHCELDNTLVGEGCVLRHSKLRNVVRIPEY